jgi:hypothetical protein
VPIIIVIIININNAIELMVCGFWRIEWHGMDIVAEIEVTDFFTIKNWLKLSKPIKIGT